MSRLECEKSKKLTLIVKLIIKINLIKKCKL